MKQIKRKKVNLKKVKAENSLKSNMVHKEEAQEVIEDRIDELSNRTHLDMNKWEEDFDFNDMTDLFCIQVGQYAKKSPCIEVILGKDIVDRWVGGYNPNDPSTPKQYVVFDRITFHSVYSGSSLQGAFEAITKAIVEYRNDPERYFRYVSEYSNEDFYFRKYEGRMPFSETALKKRAEEGRTWRASMPIKMMMFAINHAYGYVYKEEIKEAENKAIRILEEQKEKRLAKRKSIKRKKIRRKG